MNWRTIFCHLSAEYGWTPEQISDMTLDQIHAYLTSAKGDKKMGFEEARATAQEYRVGQDGWSADMMQAVCYGD